MKIISMYNKDEVMIKFDYSPEVISEVKKLYGRRYDGINKQWICPYLNYRQIFEFGLKYKFNFAMDIIQRTAEYENKQLKIPDPRIIIQELKERFPNMHDFQYEGAAFLRLNKKAFLADEMGLGKTLQSLAAIEKFRALIVCPATLKHNWKAEINKWLGKNAYIIGGDTVEIPDEEICIINYDILKKFEIQLILAKFETIIFDESHYLKNGDSARSKYAGNIVNGVENIYLLTGTPITNRPKDLKAQLKIIGKWEPFRRWENFTNRHSVVYENESARQRKNRICRDLHSSLINVIVMRRTKKDVLSSLPEKQISNIFFDLDNPDEYKKAENNFIELVQEEVEQNPNGKNSIHHLAQLQKLRMLAAKGKFNQAVEWIEDFLMTGEKLVLFGVHIEFLKQFIEHFPESASILGEMSLDERRESIEKFQNDPDCKLIIISIRAGGTGINLTSASNIAFFELDWTPAMHSQAEDRCHRIGQKNPVSVYYLLANNSIDTRMHESLTEKKDTIDRIVDGKTDESVLNQVINSYKKIKMI